MTAIGTDSYNEKINKRNPSLGPRPSNCKSLIVVVYPTEKTSKPHYTTIATLVHVVHNYISLPVRQVGGFVHPLKQMISPLGPQS